MAVRKDVLPENVDGLVLVSLTGTEVRARKTSKRKDDQPCYRLTYLTTGYEGNDLWTRDQLQAAGATLKETD